MGYMGLGCVCDSDLASDLAANTFTAMTKVLKKALKEKGNRFNTDGVVNVALFIEEHLNPKNYYGDDMDTLINDVKKLLKEKIEITKEADWNDDKEGKKYHLKCYKRMLKNLNKFKLE